MAVKQKPPTLYVVGVEGGQNNKHDDKTNRTAWGTFDDIAHARGYQRAVATHGGKARMFKVKELEEI